MNDRTLSRATAVLCLAAAMVTISACGKSESSADGQASATPDKQAADVAMLAVGQTGTYESFAAGPKMKKPVWTVTLESVRRSTHDSATVLAQFTMTAVSDCEVQKGISVCASSPRHFNVVLGDGSTVTGSIGDSKEGEALQSLSLDVGETASGLVAFKIGPDTKPEALMYEPYPGQIAPQFGFDIDV